MKVYEMNLDGLVGPSHHYAGLSFGNRASVTHAFHRSNPAQAALQGLEKMRFLHQMGIKQALLPPHSRPNLKMLHTLGFKGTPTQQIQAAHRAAPHLLSAAYSASSMWAANAATVTPSSDAHDHKVHFTPANLISNLHRHQEADFSGFLLQKIFHDERFFTHHPPVPRSVMTRDEGAANHNRFCQRHGEPGLHLFVYGKQESLSSSQHFPARQSLEASEIIVRNHQLLPQQVLFAQQNPSAIDSGVFHNDVISVANESVFLVHEKAFVDQPKLLQQLTQRAPCPLHILEIPNHQISLTDAVKSYLFNAQLITLPNTTTFKNMILIAPTECLEPNIKTVLDTLIANPNTPIANVHFLDLRQSMQNGGGPACLRLRVPLNETELAAVPSSILVSDALLNRLETWVQHHYRTELHAEDLQDPALISECFEALDELTQILKLGCIYPFQA